MLQRNEAGFWTGTQVDSVVGYPEDGAQITSHIEDSSFWFRHRNAVLEHLLSRYAPQGTIWDIGGGNGFQAARFQQLGREVVLVEPGPGCHLARERGVRRIIQTTLEGLALPASVDFPIVTVLDVLEHLKNPTELLTEIRGHMKPEGRLLVTVPAFAALWSEEDEMAHHERRYDREALRELMRRAQFTPIFESFVFQAIAPAVFILRALPYKMRGAKRLNMNTSEHAPGGLGQWMVERLLERELAVLRSGEAIRFGTSLVMVARPD